MEWNVVVIYWWFCGLRESVNNAVDEITKFKCARCVCKKLEVQIALEKQVVVWNVHRTNA